MSTSKAQKMFVIRNRGFSLNAFLCIHFRKNLLLFAPKVYSSNEFFRENAKTWEKRKVYGNNC